MSQQTRIEAKCTDKVTIEMQYIYFVNVAHQYIITFSNHHDICRIIPGMNINYDTSINLLSLSDIQYIYCTKMPIKDSGFNLKSQMPAMLAARESIFLPAGGWLRTVRQASGFSQAYVSAKAGITQQAYAQFETGETSSSISLGRLRHAAAAMECDLVYFLVPREGRAETFTKPAFGRDQTVAASPAASSSAAPPSRSAEELPLELR